MHPKLTRCISSLIGNHDRTYAEIFLQLRWVEDPTVPSIGVSVCEAKLFYNKDFVEAVPEWFLVMVLKHEAGHLFLDHIPRMKLAGALNPLGNIAADIVVNQMIPGMPDEMEINGKQCTFATLNNARKQIPDLLAEQTFEYYYGKLYAAADKIQDMSTVDDHKPMSEGDMPDDIQKAMTRQLVDKAVKRALNAGSEMAPSGQLRKLISDLLDTKTDWRRVLRNFPQDAEVVSYVANRFKRNRKYGYSYAGYKPERGVKIAVAVDLSGSITDTIKDLFATELTTLQKLGCEIEVIFFDHQVTGQETFSRSTLNKDWGGGGGTLFQPAIDAAARLDVDGLIFLTDGENFDTIKKPSFPVLWGILPGYQFNQPFGRHVILDEPKD